jgi:hypothetical protein
MRSKKAVQAIGPDLLPQFLVVIPFYYTNNYYYSLYKNEVA